VRRGRLTRRRVVRYLAPRLVFGALASTAIFVVMPGSFRAAQALLALGAIVLFSPEILDLLRANRRRSSSSR
jgi:hypothetical protein